MIMMNHKCCWMMDTPLTHYNEYNPIIVYCTLSSLCNSALELLLQSMSVTLFTAALLLDWMTKVDLKDAYFMIPIREEDREVLRFYALVMIIHLWTCNE